MKISTSEEKSISSTSNVIMVDDELDATLTIKIALEENGDFEVDTFNDAESALSAFKSGHYDLAILDVRMPGTNGFQLCRILREIDKELKVCFLTASDLTYFQDTDSDIVNKLTDCFVSKPVDVTELINKLKVILSQK
jgi:DNA-binding response OmpR family regulator